jgi:uncharacterized protein YcgI (DUF1989 family)
MRFMEATNIIRRTVVPAGAGRAVTLRAGQRVRVVDLEGGQVGDVFAFAADEPAEYLSASHTRTHTSRLFPRIGEDFVTNGRRPILTLVADTSPGVHDMLIAACDPERYRVLGVPEHASCSDNLRTALSQFGLQTGVIPQPVNVFMCIPVDPSGNLSWLPATSRAGDAITFAAAMDCVLVVSACPQDLNAINGDRPTAMEIEIL